VVEKAGEIIPQVMDVIFEERPAGAEKLIPPTECPSCKGIVEKLEGEVALRCRNLSCQAQLIRSLEFFVSKDGIDIDGMGPKIIQQLVETGMVKDISDIFRIEQADLMKLERMGEKLASRIHAAIWKKNLPLHQLLRGLNIHHVGSATARSLANYFKTLERVRSADVEELAQVGDIGEKTATIIRDFFQNERNAEVLELLILNMEGSSLEIVNEDSGKLVEGIAGLKFVVTGTLSTMGRSEAQEMIRKAGGVVTGSVSKKTDFLVAGKNAGSKLEKAQKQGVAILDETAFIAMFAEKPETADQLEQLELF
jgi:DNA ligase (NAD+)